MDCWAVQPWSFLTLRSPSLLFFSKSIFSLLKKKTYKINKMDASFCYLGIAGDVLGKVKEACSLKEWVGGLCEESPVGSVLEESLKWETCELCSDAHFILKASLVVFCRFPLFRRSLICVTL